MENLFGKLKLEVKVLLEKQIKNILYSYNDWSRAKDSKIEESVLDAIADELLSLSDFKARSVAEIKSSLNIKYEISSLFWEHCENYMHSLFDCLRRYYNLDEVTVKCLMVLTNQYMLSSKNKYEREKDACIQFFNRYGFDAHTLDPLIEKMNVSYNIDNETIPTYYQELVLQQVFEYFACPGHLPTVAEIQGEVLNFMPKDKFSKLRSIDTRHFDDFYNIGGYFQYALQQGLSLEEIVESKRKIDTMMTYYNASRSLDLFATFHQQIATVVPYLDSEVSHRSALRAKKLYEFAEECPHMITELLDQGTEKDNKKM